MEAILQQSSTVFVSFYVAISLPTSLSDIFGKKSFDLQARRQAPITSLLYDIWEFATLPRPRSTPRIGSWRGKTSETWNERWFLERFLGDWVLSFGTWQYGNRSSERSFGKCRCIPYHFKLLQMLPRYFQTYNPSTSIGEMQSSWRVKKWRSSFDICTSPIIHLHLPPKLCLSIVFCLWGPL